MKYRTLRFSKALIGCYIITVLLLLLLALGLYKLDLANWIITAGIIVIYSLSCFLGGVYIAAGENSKKLLWGLAFGLLYYVLLAIASLVISKGAPIHTTEAIRGFLVCIGAGVVGGFASP